MVQVYEIGDQNGIASLRRAERAPASPGPGQALLRVRAVCLNHRDLKIISGSYGPRRPAERVPVSDGVGEVIALGTGTTGLRLGQRVICGHFVSWLDGAFSPSVFGADLGVTLDGWLAGQILVPAASLVAVPDALSDEQAVALPAAGLTAWNALVDVGHVCAGQRVLVLGTGGVSMIALQIARMHGARVAVTSSSPGKLDIAREMGADITIDYRSEPEWGAALMRADPGGADIVIETGGLATLSQSIAAAAPNGRIVLIGALGATTANAAASIPNFSSIVGKNLVLRGITVGSRSMLAALVKAAAAGALRPVISRVFPFDEAAAAYAYLASAEHVGKVMIRC